MSSNLLDFHLNLSSIDHKITPLNASESVAFQSFTISWNLIRGYKTKVKTLPFKRSTITLNEEKNMIMSIELHNSINTCSSWLKFWLFVHIFIFGWKMLFLQPLNLIFVKNPKFYWKRLLYGFESSIKNFMAICPQIT